MGALLIAAAKFHLNLIFVGAFFFSVEAPQVQLRVLEADQEQLELRIERLENKEVVPKAK
ncbi:MAG: hypothetical protein OSB05_04130 [Akkermansiaceae bacterium]|nr:hypothetical protein [Akkermansiaceae bacterium]